MEIEPESYNLHTHSFYCGHGSGHVSEYCAEARRLGLKVLGFSEHCPVPENRWRNTRMAYAQLPEYLAEVTKEQQSEDLKVYKGLECDYFPEYDEYYRALKEKTDYLIFGVHLLQTSSDRDFALHHRPMGKKELHAYTEEYIASIESALFLYGAHPDLFGINYLAWDEEAIACSKAILSCAESYQMPLEVNAYGLRKPLVEAKEGKRWAYPLLNFWLLARDYKIKVVSGADAHSVSALSGFYPLCCEFLQCTGLSFSSLETDNGLRV